jgi:hypothetical protein
MEIDKAMVRKQLKAHNFHEVYEKTSFWGYRENNKGIMQELDVDILYSVDDDQYYCFVTTKDGREASGNPYPDLDMAINGVHWNQLDD